MSITPQVATIVRPPKEVFKKESSAFQDHEDSAISGFLFERIEYPEEGGMLVHYYDHPFPCKGNPYPDAVNAIKVPKKIFKTGAYFLRAHPLTAAFFLILPNFILRRYVRSFFEYQVREFGHLAVFPHLLEDNKYTKMVREIRRAGNKVADSCPGIWKEYVRMIVDMLGAVLEYDNAWRYRVQDVLAEINKDAFAKNPSKELARLGELEVSRERSRNVRHFSNRRFAIMAMGLRVMMFFKPVVKKTLKAFVAELDPSKVALDEADNYYCMMRPDYDTHDEPFEIRQRKAIAILGKYRSEFPNRVAEAQSSVAIKTQILDGMKEVVLNDKGFPLILFYALQDPVPDDTGKRRVTVRQMETITLKENPQLRKICVEALQKTPTV